MQPSKAVEGKIKELCQLITDIDDSHLVRRALATEAAISLFSSLSNRLNLDKAEVSDLVGGTLASSDIRMEDVEIGKLALEFRKPAEIAAE